MNWRLPDKKELNFMYWNLHKKEIGSFTDTFYWSSSDTIASFAWSQNFCNGYQNYVHKYLTLWVRYVRTFQSDKNYKIEDKTKTGIIFYKDGVNYKECKFKDEGVCNWHDAMKLFEEYCN